MPDSLQNLLKKWNGKVMSSGDVGLDSISQAYLVEMKVLEYLYSCVSVALWLGAPLCCKLSE